MRLLVVDDHEIVRAGLRGALSNAPDIAIVGEAGSGVDALQLIRRALPDVVLTDFRLPDMSGDVLCARIMKRFPSTAVVILTTYLSEEIVRQVREAGARGFITKAAGLGALRKVLEQVRSGQPTMLTERYAEEVVRSLRPAPNGDSRCLTLTPQQERILELAAGGLTYARIGERLFISESTVRFHIQRLKSRLGVRTKAELIATAIRSALIAPSSDVLDR